jgi:aminopeptidase N
MCIYDNYVPYVVKPSKPYTMQLIKALMVILSIILSSTLLNAQQVDVLHYRFEITLSDNNDSIHGKATIRFIPLSPADKTSFDLISLNKEGKGMHVSQITRETKHNTTEKINFKQESEKVQLNWPRAIASTDTTTISIVYKGIPADGLIISKNKYGMRTFFADNWPNRGRNWLPCNDHPADKASVEFIVNAPGHYQVVSNGIQVEETNLAANTKRTHWREDVPVSTKVMVIGVARFAVNLAGIVNNCIPVYSWVYPEDRDKGFYDYAQALEILPFFIKNVGPYAYKKLANVESKTIFGGLENANTIFYSEESVKGNRRSEALIAHEISHQWFGNMATEKSFAHLWLSEGFATYMTILYIENKYGKDTALAMLEEDRQQVIGFVKHSDRPVVDTNPDYMELLNANSYQKGGWVLHMLRRQLGDSVFWRSLRNYYSTYAGLTADTDDLRKVFEKESKTSLSQFFRQWLYEPGIPELKIEWNYNATTKKVNVTVKQLRGSFSFPLEIGIRSGGGRISYLTIQVTSATTNSSIAVKDKPLQFLVDPNQSLLHSATLLEVKN